MSKFGLGRGLQDLKQESVSVPDISILTGTEHVVIKQIPLAQIAANPDQPRKTFTESELTDLAASIKEKGVLQPILLRAVRGRPYMYEIVAGERRFRASKMAGLNEIPAVIKTLTDDAAMEIALIENVQRENLNPIEEGAGYQNLIEKCNYDFADVSRLIGKSISYIRNSIRLCSLPASVKKMVEQGDISASHARTIAVAENPEKLAQEILRDNLSVADTAKRVQDGARAKTSRAHANTGLPAETVRQIESSIKTALNVPVRLNQRRGGAGQIVLSFSSRGEMQDLIKKLIS